MNICVCVSILLALALGAAAQAPGGSPPCIAIPPDFSKLSYEAANQRINKEEQKKLCPQYITNLLDQLQNNDLDIDKKVLVIFLAGELQPQDYNSIEVLIKFIDIKARKLDLATGVRRWGPYPAKDALIKIGKPVIDPVLRHLTKESNKLRQQLLCEVLFRVDSRTGSHFDGGSGRKIAQGQIEKLIRSQNPGGQANLTEALDEVAKQENEFNKPR
jgi:hypothetical protein